MAEYTPILETNSSKIRIHQLNRWKVEKRRWAMLTSYDYLSAQIFDAAGIPVLLVGDSAANVVYGYDSTVSLSSAELLPLVRAVARGAKHAMIVSDLVFGSYESSPEQAFATATEFIKAGAHAVKIEGCSHILPQVRLLTQAGIPVMGHLGFTPQTVNTLSGFKVQGKDNTAAQTILEEAHALHAAGAFAIVLEMIPHDLAARITAELPIPIIGIGAGNACDAQVLVWQDLAGLGQGKPAKFVKQYGNLRETLTHIARDYQQEVMTGNFPSAEYSY